MRVGIDEKFVRVRGQRSRSESDTKFTLAAEAYISHFDGVASDSLVAIIMHRTVDALWPRNVMKRGIC